MGQRNTLAVGLPVGSNYLPSLSEFVVTARVLVTPKLLKVNFYDWAGWGPLNYTRDDVAKRFHVRRAKPADVEVVLAQNLIDRGYEIIWEAQ